MSLNVNHLYNEILDQYLNDENKTRPWIIGFSGGKDSTMVLQLVWIALKRIEPELLKRKIYVVSNNTLVENPRIERFISLTLKKIKKAANLQGLPILVEETIPKLEDSFWVRLIGLGYPAPNKMYRWCTERLKIKPTTNLILEKISENGSAIILLGTRSAESSNRANSIKKYEIKGKRLRKHQLPNTYVYAPIKDVSTNDLWQYLNQVPPPWGGTHKELVTLYRNANSGDCPLVIDDTTPSCGQSRFGCWVCTVVSKDKSMEGLIESGEDWMTPLIDLREFLVKARDNPEEFRQKERRDGSRNEKKWGPYLFETRVEILRRLLKAQKEIQKVEKINLITHQEMVLLQYYWFRDNFFKIKVSEIYQQIFSINFKISDKEKRLNQENDILLKSCREDETHVELIQDFLALQKTKVIKIRKRGFQADIENRLEQFIKDNKNVSLQ